MKRGLLLFLTLPALGPGQLLFFEAGDVTSLIQPKKPLIADVILTRKAQTPWGPLVFVEKGKYWRSSKGQICQDDEFGYSQFINLSEPRRWARVDHELKLISVIEDHHRRRRERFNPARVVLSDPKPKKIGDAILDDFKVTIRQGAGYNVTVGTWSSDELNLPLLVKYATHTTEFEQRFTNLRVENPTPGCLGSPAAIASAQG